MDFKFERVFKGPGFAETLFLGTSGGRRIIRKASNPDALPFSRTALVREIRLLRGLPDTLRPFFPDLIRTNLEDEPEDSPELPDVIFYDMPYYPPEEGWVTLSDCLLEGSISAEGARAVLGEIVDTAFTCFRIDPKTPAEDYAERTMLVSIRESIGWAKRAPAFRPLIDERRLVINGRPVRGALELAEWFGDTGRVREVLTPSRDRFLHGDFFPENILYNRETGRWKLLDPVSVRGVFRGDFVFDLNKMDDWLSGELPALRLGRFTVRISGNTVDFDVHTNVENLRNLNGLGVSEWYRERLKGGAYGDVFAEEPGWEARWLFVKAFYCFCMLPLADSSQAVARYILALRCMDEFLEAAGG